MTTFSPASARNSDLAHWEALRYGMFIHFGMSTFTGNEYGQTPAESSAYAPTHLDPAQWVRVAKASGMKYAVLTTKHCYGHCLWPSAFTDYGVQTATVKTDVVAEFVAACRKQGIMPGFYYLLGWDTHHQPHLSPPEYESFVKNQLGELLTHYGEIGELWLDIPFDMGPDTAGALQRIYDHVKGIQPHCLVLLNQSFHDGTGPRITTPTYFYKEAGSKAFPIWPTDILDGEVTLPPATGHNPWYTVDGRQFYAPMETCATLAHHWFWVEGDSLKSVWDLYHFASAVRDRKANLLLDVAPDRTGRIPEGSIRRLKELRAALDQPGRLPHSVIDRPIVTSSNVYHNDPQYDGKFAVDHNSDTRWATDDDAKSAWLELEFSEPKTFDSAYLCEGWDRVRRFSIEIELNGHWKPIYEGRKIGNDGITVRFAKATARKVRLSILEATIGPSLWDFDLFAPQG